MAQQQREPSPPPAMGSQQEPPSGIQLAVSAVGLAALPLVGWSEWVLKSTGKSSCRCRQPASGRLSPAAAPPLRAPRPACNKHCIPAWPATVGS